MTFRCNYFISRQLLMLLISIDSLGLLTWYKEKKNYILDLLWKVRAMLQNQLITFWPDLWLLITSKKDENVQITNNNNTLPGQLYSTGLDWYAIPESELEFFNYHLII